jgi:hypothetical protein
VEGPPEPAGHRPPQVHISYGELAQAAGDAFNAEERSPHVGECLYRASHLLSGTGVAAAGPYEVTKLLYATSGVLSNPFLPARSQPQLVVADSNFMGYVAVATDEGVAALGRRDIVVAWRGSVRPMEWVNDAVFVQVPATPVLGHAPSSSSLPLPPMVHWGFLSLYTSSNANSKFNKTSAKDQASSPNRLLFRSIMRAHVYIVHSNNDRACMQLIEEVKRLMEKYKGEEVSITITGHSLGGALSILSAVDIVAQGLNVPQNSSRPPCLVTAIVFACPKVGNPLFKMAFDLFQGKGLHALHVQNQGDIVPQLPRSLPDLGIEYVGVGVTLDIHTDKSPYLRKLTVNVPLQDLECYLKCMAERWGILHNLECYLHGVAGEQGDDAPFKLAVERDLALVNKSTDALREDLHVPANWWVAQNKHMVKGADGHWKLKDFDL